MPIYYLDNNRGNNANNGLSPLTPWKDLSQIAATTGATAGDAFLLADDSFWFLAPTQRVVPPTSWTGQERNPVIIGKYSPSSQSVGQRPLITWHANTVREDWTYNAGLNGWTYLYPTSNLNLLMLVRLGNSWDKPDASMLDVNSDAPVASVDGRYVVRTDSQTVLLYAPAGINPVDYYGKVVVSPFAVGAITLASGRRWITVQDIAFRESGCGVACNSLNADPAGFVVQRCRSELGGLACAIGFAGGNLRAWIRDNECEDFGAVAVQVQASGGQGVTYAEVARNRINNGGRNSSQASIYIQSRNLQGSTNCVVHGNEVSNYRWGTRGKGSDGCGIYLETGSQSVRVFGNIVHDQFIALQDNSGRQNFWTGNVVYNSRRAMRITDEANNAAAHVHFYNNTFFVGDVRQQASEFGLTSNGADYPGIWSQSGDDAIRITARNNIIANVGGQRGIAWCGLSNIGTPATYDLNNNWVYNFEADTLNTITNLPLASPPTVTNASTADPRPFLNADYSLKAPYLLEDIPMPNPLGGMGTYVQGVRLMGGRRLDPGRVPLGAFGEGRY